MNFSLGLRTASPKLLLGLGNTPLGQPNWEPKGGMGGEGGRGGGLSAVLTAAHLPKPRSWMLW